MLQTHPHIIIYNVTSTKAYHKSDELPTDLTTFENQFTVLPYLGRNGGGRVHVHFCLPQNITLPQLKTSTVLMHYLKHNRIWITPHRFQYQSIVTAGYIFMKSPSMTQLEDYIKSLKLYIIRNGKVPTELFNEEPLLSSKNTSMDISQDSNHTSGWKTVDEVPHMELSRRSLTLRAPSTEEEPNNIQVQVLELKTAKEDIQTICEVILSAKLSERGHGIFVPAPFLKESPEVVYKTALRHNQFLQHLRVIPVSGLHPSTFGMNVPDHDDPDMTFSHTIYIAKAPTTASGSPPPYLFS